MAELFYLWRERLIIILPNEMMQIHKQSLPMFSCQCLHNRYCSFSITCYPIVIATVGIPANNPENNAEIQQPNVSAGVYVPPSLRKQQQQASSLRKQQAYKTKKVPDITSQQAFPSLQPAVLNKDSRYFV